MSEDLLKSDSPAGVDLYRRIAPIYDPMAGPFLKIARRAVNRAALACGCRRMLDIGCGTGEQAQMLANEGLSVTGIDLSPAMLAKALRRPEGGLEAAYLLGNAGNLPFPPASFDCDLISLALHEMNYPEAVRVASEAIRVLVPEGKLIVFDYLGATGLSSKLSLALLHAVERFAGVNHFINFKYFVSCGGLDAFLEQFPLRPISSRAFFGGAIGLTVSEKQG